MRTQMKLCGRNGRSAKGIAKSWGINMLKSGLKKRIEERKTSATSTSVNMQLQNEILENRQSLLYDV